MTKLFLFAVKWDVWIVQDTPGAVIKRSPKQCMYSYDFANHVVL